MTAEVVAAAVDVFDERARFATEVPVVDEPSMHPPPDCPKPDCGPEPRPPPPRPCASVVPDPQATMTTAATARTSEILDMTISREVETEL